MTRGGGGGGTAKHKTQIRKACVESIEKEKSRRRRRRRIQRCGERKKTGPLAGAKTEPESRLLSFCLPEDIVLGGRGVALARFGVWGIFGFLS